MAPRIYHSIYPEYHIPTTLSVSQFLLRYNPEDVTADKIILEDLTPQAGKLTYGAFRHDTAIAAAGLVDAFDLRPGDPVLAFAPNSVNWALLAHAVFWFGGTVVGVNPLATAHELENYVTITAPKLIVCDPTLRSRVDDALRASIFTGAKPSVVELGGNSTDSFPSNYRSPSQSTQPPLPPFDLTTSDNRHHAAAIVFSSGTTGKPKAVQLSHHNLIGHMLCTRMANPEMYNSAQREVFYTSFAHIFGLISGVILPPFIGSYIAVMRQFNYEAYIDGVAKTRASMMRMVPPTAIAIAKDPRLDSMDLSSVNTILCAGATLQVEVVQRLQQLLQGVAIVQGYGMSEGSVAGLRAAWSVKKRGSVGRLYPNVTLRIVDEDLKDVEIGKPGEALFKAPTVFMGYKNNQQGTSESFVDGWLRTGDILSMDEDGFLWFIDRKKEMIKVKGNQVAPAELEDILGSHPDVLEAAVCGFFDPSQQSEFPIGYVTFHASIPAHSRHEGLEKIRKWFDGLVAPYKKLRGGLYHIDEIPKNPNGKIMRSKLPARQQAERTMARNAGVAKL
ncbi:acyl-CoA synthetases/AMP-acid ligases II [Lepidopterella palustris CBS 459.81]|uniref:Acyl-CoA synthetases/AMP-acid ligases II n=1 Tax=Lepidopterella palustris CBS 459.81 TaxID=1314670 RepID=A0A8E2EDI2_9PEZI|nr:acyl-CoA synthetases/AMP-acid ligases II [Lepidopterella palustris CBS 459.81]